MPHLGSGRRLPQPDRLVLVSRIGTTDGVQMYQYFYMSCHNGARLGQGHQGFEGGQLR